MAIKRSHFCIFILMAFTLLASGCIAIAPLSQDSSSSNMTAPYSTESEEESIVEIQEDNPIMASGLTIDDIKRYLQFQGMDDYEFPAEEYTRIEDGYFDVYECAFDDIKILNRYTDDTNMSFVECKPDQVILSGIDETMNFEAIQDCLAPAKVITVQHQLVDVASYELHYIINGVKAKFVAWDIAGDKGWNLKFVNSFNPNDDYTRLSIELLTQFFAMGIDEMASHLEVDKEVHGKGLALVSNGLYFTYYDSKLESLGYENNYEIAGVRNYFNSDEVTELFGKIEMIYIDGSEEDFYYAIYPFCNFEIRITYVLRNDGVFLMYDKISIG